jgi:hypothetical protein
MLLVLLAVAWAPLSVHCQLENLTGLEVLRCHATEASAPGGNSPCDGGSCCGWESGQYQLPASQLLVVVPTLAVIPCVLVPLESGFPLEAIFSPLEPPPPQFPRPWQFALRTALPVRAPSIAS